MPYHRILVPVDGSEASNHGLDEAIKLARALGAAVFVLHVSEPIPVPMTPDSAAYTPQLDDEMRKADASILADAVARVKAAGIACEQGVIDGAAAGVAASISAEAKRTGADMIALGTHGRTGLRRMLLGSAAEEIARDSSVPVLLVRAPAAAPESAANAGP